ncbi:MAG: hypothetical protein IJ545_05100 [Alphaproteobacteria bacterium]|nr:hypothetical protein [Alphaproteobacteria bacterium]
MKKNFELTPELFKKLLEGNKESFIAAFNEEYYLSRKGIECVFPLLADNSARQAFFLKGTLSEDRKGLVDALNIYFPAYDFLFENQKYAEIVELGYTEGARYLCQKGCKDFLVKYAQVNKSMRFAIVHAFYEEKLWLSLSGFEAELGRTGGFFRLSGVLAIQEKNGRNISEAMNLLYRGCREYVGGYIDLGSIYQALKNDDDVAWHLKHDDYPAWLDWNGRLPNAEALMIWYYKNIKDTRVQNDKKFIFKCKFRKALADPKFPTKLEEIEKALNS